MTVPAPGSEDAPGAVRIHASKWKHLGLALPCLYLLVMGVDAWRTGEPHVALALFAFGALAVVVLLAIGFSSHPVLVIDDAGIHCRRPDIGTLPWAAVVGLGLGSAMLSRAVLVVAYDETMLTPEQRERLKRERGSPLSRPRVAHHRGRMAGHPTVQIPISMLAVRPARLQRLLEQHVRYDVAS